MSKSRIGLLIVVLLLISAAIFFFISNRIQVRQFEGIPAASAVSVDAPMVVVVDGVSKLNESITTSEVWKELKDVDAIKTLGERISFLEKEILSNEKIEKVLNRRKVVISFNFMGKRDYDYLFAIALSDKRELQQFHQLTSDLRGKKNWKITDRKYSSKTIHDITRNGKALFSYSITRGILMLSTKQVLVEDAIRQLDSKEKLTNKSFEKLYDIAGDDSHLSVFINHKELPRLASIYLNRNGAKQMTKFADYAQWTGIDVNVRKEKILLNGFSMYNDTLKSYLNLFSNQKVIRKHIDDVLPAQTSMFISLGFSDFKLYQKDYENYLHGSPEYFSRLNVFKKFEANTRMSPSSFFNTVVANEVAFSVTHFDGKRPSASAFLVCETKSRSQAEQELIVLLENYTSKTGKTLAESTHVYQVDKELSFKIYEFPAERIAEKMFGKLFGWVNAKYVTFFDNYMIFGESKKAISSFLYSNVLNETLARDTKYIKYADELTGKGNMFCFVNITKGLKIFSHFMNSDLKKVIDKHSDSFRKMKAFAWQFGSDNGMIYNYATLNYDPSIREEPQAIWSQNLQQKIDFKPVFVVNHRDKKNKEVMVQDSNNALYLINKQGRILWKEQLDGKILGQIHQIDYYRNGKLQYLFNTAKKIYLLDRNGNRVAKYPVNLRSSATNGLAVFDYDKSRNYRIAVATKNHKVYLYQKEGKIISGWKFGKTDSDVKFPAQHIRIANKDYIVFADQGKVYILNREGKERVKTQSGNKFSANPIYYEKRSSKHAARLVYTNEKGDVVYQYFNGKSETIDLKDKNKNHLFNLADVDYDGTSEFIFIDDDEMTCINSKKKTLFDYTFNNSNLSDLNIYRFGKKDIKIGITSSNENRIYLLNDDGSVFQGFPLQGSSGFSVGFLSNDHSAFNLIVGNADGYLMNYHVTR
ncbi:hypothetical protein EMN47_07590 [Prolixibacteraceae bacterium JC049]|nr:hypothetical protein [Prolixibacteraceae bacterium JC049]